MCEEADECAPAVADVMLLYADGQTLKQEQDESTSSPELVCSIRHTLLLPSLPVRFLTLLFPSVLLLSIIVNSSGGTISGLRNKGLWFFFFMCELFWLVGLCGT